MKKLGYRVSEAFVCSLDNAVYPVHRSRLILTVTQVWMSEFVTIIARGDQVSLRVIAQLTQNSLCMDMEEVH